jgi:LysW-gamma-L-lysine carboxypeptidase
MGQGTKQVVLLGHIDTVPGEIKVERDDISLYGRGSVDAKGPLACLVDAVAQVGAREGWQFVVIGAVEEERESDGARYVVDQYRPEFAIVGEPNQWDRVALGYKGSAWSGLTFKRAQAHTASGEVTAAEAAVDGWLKIRAYADSYNADKQRVFAQLLATLNAFEADSNEFEQCALLKIGVRLPVEVSPEAWYEKLEEIVPEARLERVGVAVPAWTCEKNTPLVRAFLSGIRSEAGEPRFVYKTGTADLNIVAPIWKCPAVVYGPGDSSLDHTPNEHILLNDYVKSVRVLCRALSALTK